MAPIFSPGDGKIEEICSLPYGPLDANVQFSVMGGTFSVTRTRVY
jgi:hypothetical protein